MTTVICKEKQPIPLDKKLDNILKKGTVTPENHIQPNLPQVKESTILSGKELFNTGSASNTLTEQLPETSLLLPTVIEEDKKEEAMIDMLNDDERVWFCLDSIGKLKPNDKLLITQDLLAVDDRYLLQFFRRWKSGDSREKVIDKLFSIINITLYRINSIIDEEKDGIKLKTILQKYHFKLKLAECGINNLSQTYDDSLSKSKINTILEKICDVFKILDDELLKC